MRSTLHILLLSALLLTVWAGDSDTDNDWDNISDLNTIKDEVSYPVGPPVTEINADWVKAEAGVIESEPIRIFTFDETQSMKIAIERHKENEARHKENEARLIEEKKATDRLKKEVDALANSAKRLERDAKRLEEEKQEQAKRTKAKDLESQAKDDKIKRLEESQKADKIKRARKFASATPSADPVSHFGRASNEFGEIGLVRSKINKNYGKLGTCIAERGDIGRIIQKKQTNTDKDCFTIAVSWIKKARQFGQRKPTKHTGWYKRSSLESVVYDKKFDKDFKIGREIRIHRFQPSTVDEYHSMKTIDVKKFLEDNVGTLTEDWEYADLKKRRGRPPLL